MKEPNRNMKPRKSILKHDGPVMKKASIQIQESDTIGTIPTKTENKEIEI